VTKSAFHSARVKLATMAFLCVSCHLVGLWPRPTLLRSHFRTPRSVESLMSEAVCVLVRVTLEISNLGKMRFW
jgi:hypothetical protein